MRSRAVGVVTVSRMGAPGARVSSSRASASAAVDSPIEAPWIQAAHPPSRRVSPMRSLQRTRSAPRRNGRVYGASAPISGAIAR